MTHLRKLEAYRVYENLHWENPNKETLPSFSPHNPNVRFGHMDFSKLPFTDRDSYLAWRQSWRLAYHFVSIAIRAEKAARDAAPHNEYTPSIQYRVHTFKSTAREMMEQRRLSKLKSVELYKNRFTTTSEQTILPTSLRGSVECTEGP